MQQFVHLHLHSQYSVLDGAIKFKELVKRANALGQGAVAMTDHGNMHGAIEFYEVASGAGLKPIIGCEVYLTAGSRFDKRPLSQGGAATHHLTLLAENFEGYRNLCRLVTAAYIDGFYFKPRIDHELLQQLSGGIVCLTGCLSSEFAEYAKRGDLEGGREILKKYHTVFGDRLYLEVQPHAVPEQQQLNRMARELGTELGIPLVATNDCHYLTPDDHYAQEVLMCVSTGKLITDEDRIRHEHARLHFKSEEEMLHELPGFEDAVARTIEIAERCNVSFDFNTYHMPKFESESGGSIEEQFAVEARKGLEKRIAEFERRGNPPTEELARAYQERLEEEIELILKMGFAGYFLVVSDFILWAKNNDIPVGPGRGSAAGSLVAYTLYITEIDPIPNKLLFERFLNPERVSLPDIDVDFCIYGRDRVIEYVCERYGRDKVAQIVTFGTLKAKAAIKDVGRALGLSYAETDRIAKLIPAPRQGFDYPIAEALKMEKRLREYAEGEGRELIELAQKLEGLSRHTSTHAAGLVIANRPVVEFMPLMVDKDNQVVSQFSMNYVEKIGLVKFDFLGLKTLSVLHEAVRLTKLTTGVSIDLNALPLDDVRTYRLISKGRTTGVFQLESSGITEMVSRMKPSCFEDLVAILALYRPGPLDAGMVDHYINRKHGREPVKYLHPILESILKDTYGIILYQEQIMQIARDMAGYSLGQADMLRRAMGKKKPEEMAKQREIFLAGSKQRGVPDAVAVEVFDQMETFARYGFNRSHSVAYALISFQTAYLKAHYPHQFLAALMSFEMGDTDKTLKNISECREMGIEILPPDVNSGSTNFSVRNKKIVFGLAAIKNVGEKAVDAITQEREANGQYSSLLDFCQRLDSSFTNRRTVENFIKAGAFDFVGLPRAELIERLEEVLKYAQRLKDRANSNQMALFGGAEDAASDVFQPNRDLLPEWPINIRLAHEREALGFYLSGHPLEKFRSDLRRLGASTVEDLRSAADGSQVTAAGIITFLKEKNTKKGDRYATFTLEDLLGTIEVIVWPDTYLAVHELLQSEDPILLTGRLDVSDERRSLIASNVQSVIQLRDKSATQAVIHIRAGEHTAEQLQALRELLTGHQGECSVRLVVRKPAHSETSIALPDSVRIAPSEALCNKVEALFGEPLLTFR
ncbi:MAG: DNA polymerase III subunit alpha [Bdellovibrionales bacterium]|nr:DNA polymerase III subunit alpha [Bdellovibrionales bacterium]